MYSLRAAVVRGPPRLTAYNEELRFRFFRLRFHFEAQDCVSFPEQMAANTLRGAFGSIFRRLVCAPECVGVHSCPFRIECAYARTFEPGAVDGGPSGFSHWPRPFVFRASHLDGRCVAAGTSFHFDVHLFDIRRPAAAYFVRAFAE